MGSTSQSLIAPSGRSSLRTRIYESAWRRRRFVQGALGASLIGLVVMGLGALVAPPTAAFPVFALALGFGALFLASAAAWLSLPAWFSPSFRLFAWNLARLDVFLRTLRRQMVSRPVVKALLATPFAIVLWALYEMLGAGIEAFLSFVGIGLLLTLFLTLRLSRKRIYVADFTDYAAESPDQGMGGALASRLRNELASIAALYGQVDEEPSGVGTPKSLKQPPDLALGVQGNAADLAQTIGRDFNLKMMGIEIPVGALLAALGGWSRGPRLSGSLHRVGEKYLLIAEISGGGKRGSWRVTQDDLTEEDRGLAGSTAVYKLVEQLAYRIVTGLSDMGSPRWEAVRAFTEGLRAYRKIQRTRKDYHLQLRRAERAFIAALSEDDQFAQCYHNLGVVYVKLGQTDSAQTAFRQAIEANPDSFEAYYALSSLYYGKGEARNAEIQSIKGLGVDAGHPRAWNLRGLAHWEREPLETGSWSEVEMSFALAAALAWREFCRAVRRDGPDAAEAQRKGELASIVTGNLADAFLQKSAEQLECNEPRAVVVAGARRSAAWFRHALLLRPRDSALQLSLGRALILGQDWAGARDALYLAYGEGLPAEMRPLRWACIAAVRHQLWKITGKDLERQKLRDARRNFRDFIVPPEEVILGHGLRSGPEDEGMAQAPEDYLEVLAWLEGEVARLAVWIGAGRRDPLASLRRVLRALAALEGRSRGPSRAGGRRRGRQGWLRAQALVRAARLDLAARPRLARKHLGEALAILAPEHYRQIEKQGLYSLLALTCLREARETGEASRLQEALALAEKSVRQEPLSPTRRWVLAEVYSALKDSEQLFLESRAALELGSVPEILGNPLVLASMAEEWFRRASALQVQESRRGELERAFQFFDHVRKLIESEPVDVEQHAAHAALHFWLGRFRCELLDCVRGVGQLEIARAMGYRPVQTRLLLGQTYADSGAFEQARQAFREAAHRAWKKVWAARRRRGAAETAVLADSSRPEELLAEALLRLSLLYVESGVRIRQAEQLTRIVMTRTMMSRTAMPRTGLSAPRRSDLRRSDLRALAHEILGRIHLADRRVDSALEELRKALEIQPSAGAWSAMAVAQIEKAAIGGEREPHLAEARQACGRAELLDLRGSCRREIALAQERLLSLSRANRSETPPVPAEAQPELVF